MGQQNKVRVYGFAITQVSLLQPINIMLKNKYEGLRKNFGLGMSEGISAPSGENLRRETEWKNKV